MDNLSVAGGDDELEEEERRRRAEQAGEAGDSGSDAAESGWCDNASLFGCDLPDCDLPGCDGCDLPDCDCGGCDLLRVSTLLATIALVAPSRAGGLVTALIRAYRRWLTRFTPTCPSTPSCSAYALTAVEMLGVRAGLRAAAGRVRACGGRTGRR